MRKLLIFSLLMAASVPAYLMCMEKDELQEEQSIKLKIINACKDSYFFTKEQKILAIIRPLCEQLTMLKPTVWEPTDKDGQTALHRAVIANHCNVIKLLLDCGAKIAVKDKRGETPLHVAVDRGYVAIVSLLLDNGADVNVQDRYGETPLHVAVTSQNYDTSLVKLLLTYGARQDIKNNQRYTPYGEAVWCKNREAMSALNPYEAINDLVLCIEDAYYYRHGQQLCVEKMKALAATDNMSCLINKSFAGGKTLLHYAALRNCDIVLEAMLEYGTDGNALNNERKTPLQVAVQNCAYAAIPVLSSPSTRRHNCAMLLKSILGDGIIRNILDHEGKPVSGPQRYNNLEHNKLHSTSNGWVKPLKKICGGMISLITLYLGYRWYTAIPTIPTNMSAQNINQELINALINKSYEYAYRLADKNSEAVQKLSDTEKAYLQQLINHEENAIAQEAADNAASLNPLKQFFTKKISIDLHYLVSLSQTLENVEDI